MRPCPAAFLARSPDDLAASRTIRTRPHYAEKALLVTRLAASLAGDAAFGLGPFFGTAAVACAAAFKPRDPQLFFFSVRGVFEGDLEIVSQIRAPLNRTAAAAARSEHIAKTEHIEDVFDIGESGIETGSGTRRRMPESIVCCTLFRIGKHGIGFRTFLEFVLGCVIARIFVRVMLYRQCSVSRVLSQLRSRCVSHPKLRNSPSLPYVSGQWSVVSGQCFRNEQPTNNE